MSSLILCDIIVSGVGRRTPVSVTLRPFWSEILNYFTTTRTHHSFKFSDCSAENGMYPVRLHEQRPERQRYANANKK